MPLFTLHLEFLLEASAQKEITFSLTSPASKQGQAAELYSVKCERKGFIAYFPEGPYKPFMWFSIFFSHPISAKC